MSSDAFDAAFHLLQKRFIEHLPADQALMQQCLLDMHDPSSAHASLTQLHFLAHRYSGNGSSFGFPAISQTARALEIAVQRLLKEPLTAAGIAEIETLFARLAASFQEAADKNLRN